MHPKLQETLTRLNLNSLDSLLEKAVEQHGLAGIHEAANWFPIFDEESLTGIIDDIDANGFLNPVKITDDDIVLDGRNRLIVSLVIEKDPPFQRWNPPDVVEYILSENVHRRHMSTGQKAFVALQAEAYFAERAKQRQRESGRFAGKDENGKPKENLQVEALAPQPEEQPKPASKKRAPQASDLAAATVGISGRRVREAKKVEQVAPDLMKQVADGKMPLKTAYKEARQRERQAPSSEPLPAPAPEVQPDNIIFLPTHDGREIEYPKPKGKPVFNQTNDAVDWAGWTWNPVTGCNHGCSYCYARDIANNARMKAVYPVGFTPLFHHERLDAPSNSKIPKSAAENPSDGRVFVCSMADLFGAWVPEDWINQVMEATLKAPEWEYLFLTKFPQRLHRLTLPESAWVGASIDTVKRAGHTLDALRKVEGVRVKWLSLEPLLHPLDLDLTGIDWVVIGAQSATNQPDGRHPEFAPDFEWVMNIVAAARKAGTAVYLKQNLLGRTSDQWPGMKLPQEMPTARR